MGQVKSDGAMRGIRGSRRIKSVQEGSRVFKKDQVGLSRLKWGQVKSDGAKRDIRGSRTTKSVQEGSSRVKKA